MSSSVSGTTGHGPGASEASTRVLVVDDHEVLAESLSLVLDAEPDLSPVGIAPTLARARELLPALTPDVLLLDVRLPDGDGIDFIGEVHGLSPSTRVVVLTASTADHVLVAAIEAGASGYLSKSGSVADVVTAVRAAAADEAVISPEMLIQLPHMRRRQEVAVDGAHRARARGARAGRRGTAERAIATRLHVSVHTVRNHIANLSAKLGAHSKLEALSIAVRSGLVDR